MADDSNQSSRRQSRSSLPRSQARRKSQQSKSPELVFVQNKVPADFSPPKAASETGRRISDSSLLRRDSSNAGHETKHHLSVRLGNSFWSIPKGIPSSSLLEHIATSRFFHHYVSPTRTFFRLDLDFTHEIIDGASKRAVLAEAVVAMGILTLPLPCKDRSVAARLRHSRALRLTNKALQNHEYAKSDEILMAVILLGLYETTPDTTHSISSWTSHLDGARYLLRLRGETLLQTGAAYRMFNILRVQILLNCFMSMQRVPSDLMRLSDSMADSQTDDERTASHLMTLYARMCDLIAASKEHASLNIFDMIADGVDLDRELASWAENVPTSFQASRRPADSTVKAYSDEYEIYESIWSAEAWVLYRSARYGVNSLLFSFYSALAMREAESPSPALFAEGLQVAETTADMRNRVQQCANTLETLRVEMCSGIPYLLDLHRPATTNLRDLPLNKRTLVMNLLVFLTRMQGTGDKMRTWAEDLHVELQAEEELDKGAIWMNDPSAQQ